jgi:elongation factor G
MEVEIVTPEGYLSEVIADLNSRRGQIQNLEARTGSQVITGRVPLSEMFGYATDLRSVTQGRANYTMQFASYEPAPKEVAESIVAKATG